VAVFLLTLPNPAVLEKSAVCSKDFEHVTWASATLLPARELPLLAGSSGLIPVYRDDRADTGQQTAKKRSERDKPLGGAAGN
jgi:hypothetical protein